MMMDGADLLTWLSVFSKYSCTQDSADVNGLPRIFLFLKTRKEKNLPGIVSAWSRWVWKNGGIYFYQFGGNIKILN